MRKFFALTILLASAVVFAACSGSSTEPPQNPGDTPSASYKRLFAAVKAKNPESIRKEMSAKTLALVKSVAAQQKKSEDEVVANGFTATTFSPLLPEIRDERVKDKMGAVEVWNDKDKIWEDLAFIREADGWKLAIGDVFAKTWNSPGKGQAARDREASNSMPGLNTGPQMMPMPSNTNGRSPVPAPPIAQPNSKRE